MAYKFQLGPAVLSGNLEQEGDITIDGGDLKMGANVAVAQNRNAFLSTVSASALVDSSLTAGRVAFVGADGRLVDSGDLLWDGADLDALSGRMRAADMSASADIQTGQDLIAGRDVTAGRNLVVSLSASAAHLSSSGGLEGDLSADSLRNRDTDDLAEGSSNLYFTNARARAAVSVTDAGGDGSLAYDSGTGVITYTGPSAAEVRAHFSGGEMIDIASGVVSINDSEFSGSWDDVLATKDTGDLAEGSNLYFTDARARAAISVTDAGGDGSLAYNNSTGVLTYTGPSASEVRAHFSAGEMITITDGEVAINASVFSASSDVRFDAKMAAADTDDLSEGSSNLYFTDARARDAISVTDAGGDGSLAYNSGTGVITYTGPSDAEVRAHFGVADTNSVDMSFDSSNGEFSADLKLNSGDGDASFEIVAGGLRLKSSVAGSGITLTDGVLSVDSGAQNAIGDAPGDLEVGFNYGSADITADRTWTLPSDYAAGDVVHVKAPLVGSNKIIVAADSGDTIDGVAQIEIESDQGAVSLMAISDSAWKIF